MYTTLNAIRKRQPCAHGWERLLKHLGKTSPDDESLSLLTILESNGLDDTLWCFLAVEGFEKEKLLLGVAYAKEVEHLMPAESKKALDVYERYANGLATEDEFDAARRAASDAFYAAWAAACAAVARAVDARAAAARAADAACTAARADAWSAADAACTAARADAWSAAAAAHSNMKAKQETQLRELLEKTK